MERHHEVLQELREPTKSLRRSIPDALRAWEAVLEFQCELSSPVPS